MDSSSKFYSESEVAENGQVLSDKDETGATSAEYEYISGSSVVSSIKYPKRRRLNGERCILLSKSFRAGKMNKYGPKTDMRLKLSV